MENIKKLFKVYLDLIFPPFCVGCKDKDINFLCEKCYEKINFIKDNFCAKCGGVAEGKIISGTICGKCRTEKKYWTISRSVARYSEVLKDIIHKFKYNKKKYLAKPLSNLMIDYIRNNSSIDPKNIDIIIPVPLHKKRLRERGFNQSELLGRCLSEDFKIELATNVLFRTKNTVPQFNLSPFQRAENVKGAFTVKNDEIIKNKNVLLIDDIYTTGSTLREASKSLKKTKMKNIYCLTLAR